jgi:hypothetical protein
MVRERDWYNIRISKALSRERTIPTERHMADILNFKSEVTMLKLTAAVTDLNVRGI